MSAIEYYLKKFMRESLNSRTSMAITSTSALAVTACGSGSGGSDISVTGFPNSYVPPSSNYVSPNEVDPNFEILKPIYIEPYWVESLEMDQWDDHILPMLEVYERLIHYTFSETYPKYDSFDLTGVESATEEMKTATGDILSKLEDILDVSFSQSEDPNALNVIAVSTSNQETTAGISYLPNIFIEIGMDVFIAKGYANPHFLSVLTTNYDYEVLVHEIGHALGLKHPFEASGENSSTLSRHEDNTFNTAMSYDDDPTSFNGTFRPLDWMVLAKFYGVKSTYNAGDDTYVFSNLGAKFILDGAGVDTISAYDRSEDVTIDLRPGAQSYLDNKSNYITEPNQLTISHGSNIENVVTGGGDDTVIGSDLDNLISTGSGSDTIYAGNGADIINSGTGADRVDLSESVQSRDTVKLEEPSVDSGIDTIYGFMQGMLGDIFDVSSILRPVFELFPLVVSGSAPTANFSKGILRLVGSDASTVSDLSDAFKRGGAFETLSIDTGSTALIISANSQATGEDQSLFLGETRGGEISITQLAILQGNALDIDEWHIDNFDFVA